MSFGWTLSTPCNTFDVARSEIGGYVAPLLLLTPPAQLWGIQHRCKLEWVCNTSKAALSTVRKSTSTTVVHSLNNTNRKKLIFSHKFAHIQSASIVRSDKNGSKGTNFPEQACLGHRTRTQSVTIELMNWQLGIAINHLFPNQWKPRSIIQMSKSPY